MPLFQPPEQDIAWTGIHTVPSKLIPFQARLSTTALYAPVNVTPPFLTSSGDLGQPHDGDVLFCQAGIWDGAPTPVLTYKWFDNEGNDYGTTTQDFTISGNEGRSMHCVETATNSQGQATCSSDSSGIIS